MDIYSLLDNIKNLWGEKFAAVAVFAWAVAWGAAQNYFDKLSAPTIAGPGKADILRYGMDIMQASDPKSACKAAANGIYELLLPNFGNVMNPAVSAVTDIIGTGHRLGNENSTPGGEGKSSPEVYEGYSQNTGIILKDNIINQEKKSKQDNEGD